MLLDGFEVTTRIPSLLIILPEKTADKSCERF
jgi:hypothetical protein